MANISQQKMLGQMSPIWSIFLWKPPWVTGIPKDFGGSGDPSPYTAHGVLMGIKAAAHEKFGSDNLKGKRIAVQGLGNVGSNLVRYLVEEGAQVIVADIDQARVKECHDKFKVETVNVDELLFVPCDILAPCALGAIINDSTIQRLKCKIVAGGANNQLAEPRHGDQLP
jgi:leucine dehydrogenase